MKKSVFGLVVTTRGFFNPKLAQVGREQLMQKLDSMGYEYVVLSVEDTQYGCVETYEDAEKCANLFKQHRDKIDGIIITAPNFGDEIAAVNSVHLADLNVPVLVHACDDDVDKMDLSHRRDSFCGKLSICNNLYQYGIKFTVTEQHTSDILSDTFTKDIEAFDRTCRVVNGMRGARIAQIGTRPAAFQTVRFSEKLLQKSGITVVPVDLSDIYAAAEGLKGNPDVKDRIAAIKAYGHVAPHIKEDRIERSARLSMAVERFLDENKCVAGAMQCWTSVVENYGCAACLPMSLESEKGRAMACETDINGALSMYALNLASGRPSGYLDWNNSFLDDRDMCIMIHCSNYPKSFMGREFEISNLDVMGAAKGEEICFGACKAQIAPGPMTFAKITTDENIGQMKAYVGEGEFTDDPVVTPGAPGVVRIKGLQKLMKYICYNGFEHHVSMNRSNSADVINEALGKYLGWQVYKHE